MNSELIEMEKKAHRLNLAGFRLRQRRIELQGVVANLQKEENELREVYDDLIDQIYSLKWSDSATGT